MAKILVVDDERVLVKGITFNLKNDGYQVETGYDGEEAVELAREGNFDLIILDLMMPKIDGLQACMRIREFSNVPVIMLTAKGEDADKIMGFECGADDYITKPFNILELKARVRALLRRSGAAVQRQAAKSPLTVGHIRLDPNERSAWKDGVPVDLTAKEFDLMELLMRNPGRVYSRENLLNVVWGYEYIGDYRTVDVHVRRLREKLELDPANPEYILNYLLTQNGLDPAADVTIEWKSEPSEIVAQMAAEDHVIAMLPQPFVTVAQSKFDDLTIRLDLTKEWDALDNGSQLNTAGLVVRTEFAKEHPEAVAAFLKEYAASTQYVNENVSEAAQLVAQYDIVEAAVAEKAIPYCNIVCITGEEMKSSVQGYFQVLFDQNPQSVGGALPGDDFYYLGQ